MDMQNKTLAIFGCGYVGTAFARQALARGIEVTALTRNDEVVSTLREIGVPHIVQANLDDDSWHAQVAPKQDYVINCVSSAGGGLAGYRQSYINGQKCLLAWAERGEVDTAVYTSSTGVYPQKDGEFVDEESSTEGVSERGELLLEAEALWRGSSVFKRWFILRLSGIYGPGRHSLLKQLREGHQVLPGRADAILNLIHRDDVCSAIWAALEAAETVQNCVYNVCDGHHATKAEVAAWLATQLKCEAPQFDPQRASSRRVVGDRRIDALKLREELDWSPTFPDYKMGYDMILNKR